MVSKSQNSWVAGTVQSSNMRECMGTHTHSKLNLLRPRTKNAYSFLLAYSTEQKIIKTLVWWRELSKV